MIEVNAGLDRLTGVHDHMNGHPSMTQRMLDQPAVNVIVVGHLEAFMVCLLYTSDAADE